MATFTPPPSNDYLLQLRYENAVRQVGTASRSTAQAFRFYVEIQGILRAEFLECGGLTMEREIKEVEEGGVNDFVHKLPGRMKYSNITLKRGITYDRELWNWFRKGMYDGNVKRANMSIILGNAEGRKVKQWDVLEAFPVKWSGADLSTTTLEVAAETLEIAHHGLELSAEEGNPLGAGWDVATTPTPAETLRAQVPSFWKLEKPTSDIGEEVEEQAFWDMLEEERANQGGDKDDAEKP
jgi:phage tail-like protein